MAVVLHKNIGINIKDRPLFIEGGWGGVKQLKKLPFQQKCVKKNHVRGAMGKKTEQVLSAIHVLFSMLNKFLHK